LTIINSFRTERDEARPSERTEQSGAETRRDGPDHLLDGLTVRHGTMG
jgi:hypothetical protein